MAAEVSVGDVVRVEKGASIRVMIPRHFTKTQALGNFHDLEEALVTAGEPYNTLGTEYLTGDYVVSSIEQVSTGGGHNEIATYKKMYTLTRMDLQEFTLRVDYKTISQQDIHVVGEAECVWRWTKKPVDLM